MKRIILAFSLLFSAALATVPNPAARVDYDSDGKADLSSYYYAYPWNFDFSGNGFDPYGTPDLTGYAYAPGPQFPAPGDFDGDGYTDMSFKDPTGVWRIDFASNGFGEIGTAPMGLDSSLEYYSENWESDSCKPAIGDYDGDGKSDIAVFCNEGYTRSGWEIDYSSNGFGSVDDGISEWFVGDHHPVPADYDGDGMTDIAIKMDTYGGYFMINYASNGFSGGWDDYYSDWGDADYVAAPADFDGDGSADLAVMYRAGYATWYLDFASNGYANGYGYADEYHTPFGTVGDIPVPSDYDGDGKADLSAKSNYYGAWLIDYSGNTFGSGDEWLDGWGGSDTRPMYKSRASAKVDPARLTQGSGLVSFAFNLAKAAKVSVKVYGLDGKQIASLYDGDLGVGANKLTWNKKDLSEKGLKRGTYFLRLEAGEYHTSRRLALVD
jgi:hypothetical protein